jgi:hypothetical protein
VRGNERPGLSNDKGGRKDDSRHDDAIRLRRTLCKESSTNGLQLLWWPIASVKREYLRKTSSELLEYGQKITRAHLAEPCHPSAEGSHVDEAITDLPPWLPDEWVEG